MTISILGARTETHHLTRTNTFSQACPSLDSSSQPKTHSYHRKVRFNITPQLTSKHLLTSIRVATFKSRCRLQELLLLLTPTLRATLSSSQAELKTSPSPLTISMTGTWAKLSRQSTWVANLVLYSSCSSSPGF